MYAKLFKLRKESTEVGIQIRFASWNCLWNTHLQMTLVFFYSTKEYNECLHDIQRTLSEIMNGATREFLQSKR